MIPMWTQEGAEVQHGLYQIARVLQSLDYPGLAQDALDTLGQLTDAQHGLLTLVDADLSVEHACHLSCTRTTLPWQVLIELGLAGYVLHSRRTVVIHNLARDPRWPHTEGLPRRGSACGVPLLHGEQILGLFLLIHAHVDYFTQERVAFLEATADLTAQAVINAREHAALRQQAALRDGLVIAPTVHDPDAAARTDDEHRYLREALTAMAYHDMRNPLQTIRLSLQKLTQLLANHDNAAVLTLLQTGTRGTRQLKRLVDSLLDIQHLQASGTLLNRRATDLHMLLAEAVQLIQPLAQDAGLRLRCALADDLPVLSLDDDMVLRVVTNLLENAVKYTPEGGDVTLHATVEGDHALITVQDTGPGIPAEYLDTVFEQYQRVKYQDAPRGVGLGLTFCRMAVQAHGGCIWAESVPGQGATFRFTLPLMEYTTDETEQAPTVAAV